MNIKAFGIAVCCLLLVACGTPEERVESYMARAQELFEAGEYQDARLEIANALQIDPKQSEARVLAAKISIEEGEYRGAFLELQTAAEIDPDSLDTQVLLGEIYYLAKYSSGLEESAARAEQIDPADPRVMLLRSRALNIGGDRQAAMDKVDEAIGRDPDFERAIIYKASLMGQGGDTDGGLALLDERAASLPVEETEQLRNFRIALLENVGRDAEVEDELRSLARDFPENPRYNDVLVSRFVFEGRVDEAEQVMKDLAERDDDGYERRMKLIGFVADQRTTDAAVDMTRAFLEEEPEAIQLQLTLARLLESQERLDEAAAEYRQVTVLGPGTEESFEARNRIVSILVRQGKPEQARTLAEEILEEQPNNVDALLARAAFNFTDGNFETVISDARIALRKDPESANALLFLARGHAEIGETLLAQDAYLQLLASDPSNQTARNELANLFMQQAEFDRAEELLREQPDVVDSQLGLIRVLLARGDLAEAEQIARQLIAADESNSRGHIELGLVLEQAGKIPEAKAAFRRALSLTPDSGAAINGLVSLLQETGETDAAIELLQQKIRELPNRIGLRLLLANAYLRAGNQQQAVEIYEELTAGPRNVVAQLAYRELAAQYAPGSERRIDTLRAGVEAFPDDPEMSIYLAQELQRTGNAQQAIDVYEAALARNADNDLIANNYAAMLLDEATDPASMARALEVAKRFRDSQSAPFLDTLGWAYYQNGDYPNAVRYLENAVARAGQIPALRYHLGMAYLKTGNTVNARQELERAISMTDNEFPGKAEAREALAELSSG